jgi:hypothetical protein
MNADQALDVINKVFLDAWIAAGYDVSDVRWNDVPGTLPTRTWARVTVRHDSGAQHTFGEQRTFTNTGTVTVQVFTPIGDGTNYSAATNVVNAYRDSKNPLVWFRNARLKEVGSSGVFEQTNVLADFTYDDLR